MNAKGKWKRSDESVYDSHRRGRFNGDIDRDLTYFLCRFLGALERTAEASRAGADVRADIGGGYPKNAKRWDRFLLVNQKAPAPAPAVTFQSNGCLTLSHP